MLPGCTCALLDQQKLLSSSCSGSKHPTHDSKCTAHFPSWRQTQITSTCCICRDVRGEGPQQDASASPGPLGSFLSTLHAYYICAATGRCSRPQPPGAVFPQCQSLRVIPLSVPPSCGKIHSYEPEPFVGPRSVRLWSFLLTCIIYHGLPRRIPRRGP